MKNSLLVDLFLVSAWNLHAPMYNRLSGLLHAHMNGTSIPSAELTENHIIQDSQNISDHEYENALTREDNRSDIREAMNDTMIGSTAVISVRGVLARHSDQVNGECQPQGRSYDHIISQLHAAVTAGAQAIALRMETPGGAASGCQEVFECIHAISAAGTPVHAFVDGGCFSAGMYIAAACDSITLSSRSAELGSIGTIMSTYDDSVAWAEAGLKSVVIRSGPYKALCQPGEEITDHTRAELQRTCDSYAGAFYDAVTMGRGLNTDQTSAVCNGRTWHAAEAIELGIADNIASWDAFISEITNTYPPTNQSPPEENPMSLFKGKKKSTPQSVDTPTETPANDAVPTPSSDGISKAEFSALAKQFPSAIDAITAMDEKGDDAQAIELALYKAQNVELREAQNSESDTTTAELAEAKKENATLQAAVDKNAAWKSTASEDEDPGSDDSTATASTYAELKSEWDNSSDIQDNFALGGFPSYIEHKLIEGAISKSTANAMLAELKSESVNS